MAKKSSHILSEFDLKAHIASYPELYEDLAVDVLEERLEMVCGIDLCWVNDNSEDCNVDLCWVDT